MKFNNTNISIINHKSQNNPNLNQNNKRNIIKNI